MECIIHHILLYHDSCLYWCLAYVSESISSMHIYVVIMSPYPRDRGVTHRLSWECRASPYKSFCANSFPYQTLSYVSVTPIWDLKSHLASQGMYMGWCFSTDWRIDDIHFLDALLCTSIPIFIPHVWTWLNFLTTNLLLYAIRDGASKSIRLSPYLSNYDPSFIFFTKSYTQFFVIE